MNTLPAIGFASISNQKISCIAEIYYTLAKVLQPICYRICTLPREGMYFPFFHHYQGSIDFNIVNIHPTEEMYFFVPTGNRDDIE